MNAPPPPTQCYVKGKHVHIFIFVIKCYYPSIVFFIAVSSILNFFGLLIVPLFWPTSLYFLMQFAFCTPFQSFNFVFICPAHFTFHSSLQSFLVCNLFNDCLFLCALSFFCIELTLFHSHLLTLECFLVSASSHCKVSLSLSLLFSSKFSLLISSLIQFPAFLLSGYEWVVLYLDKYCML